MSPPLIVEVRRGAEIESRHEVDVAVVGADGHRSGWGDPSRLVLARSAMKPIQAVPLVRTGAAAAAGLSGERLALACASHSGERGHVDAVEGWLTDLGFTADTLECGVQIGHPDALHNNCSGKHCGFLTVCRHLGLDPAGYLAADHPLQAQHITPIIEELCGVSVLGQTPGIDGCGIPVWAVPLESLALGWARLSATTEGETLLSAMMAEPWMVAGTDRCCTKVMEAAAGRIAVKTGAEGVYAAVAPGDGLGVALKCRDGASRGSEAALRFVLGDLGLLADGLPDTLRNWAGTVTGTVSVTPR